MSSSWNSITFLRNVKENDGRRNRQWIKRVLVWIGVLQVGFLLLYLLIRVEEGPPERTSLRVPSRETLMSSSHSHANKELAVLEANYFLIDLDVTNIQPAAPSSAGRSTASYSGVRATFCPIDWHLQKNQPSSVPMFRDLVKGSSHCDSHKVQYDLSTIVSKIRRHDMDAIISNTKNNNPHYGSTAVHHLALKGVVFHETRCGSTLVANLLSAQDPVTNRVYSENSVLLQALTACDSEHLTGTNKCDSQIASTLVQDTIYLLNRSSDKREKNVFYKFQSAATHHISLFAQNFPTVPWVFVYRDGVEIMSSHFQNKGVPVSDSNTKLNHAECLRSRKNPPALVQELVEGRPLESLSSEEYCAVHLASLCESALRQQASSSHVLGRFVNYDALPEAVWDWILPTHFGVSPIHSHQLEHMKTTATVYSKERLSNATWQEDSARKHDMASKEVQDAATLFLDEPYRRMEHLSL